MFRPREKMEPVIANRWKHVVDFHKIRLGRRFAYPAADHRPASVAVSFLRTGWHAFAGKDGGHHPSCASSNSVHPPGPAPHHAAFVSDLTR